MGTDTKITNLVNHAQSSYTKGHRWMSVVPRFPRFQLNFFTSGEEEIWGEIIQNYPVVKAIVLHSRGRFSRYFVDEVMKQFQGDSDIELCELLDAACARVSAETHFGKKFLNSREGMCNQLMAISYTNVMDDVDMSVAISCANSSSVGEPAQKKHRVHLKPPGMHKHFANLADEKVTDVKVLNASLGIDGPDWEKWQSMCSFASIEDDLLLYLAILGGKTYPSYYDRIIGKYYSTKNVFSTTHPNEYVVNENTNAPTLDFKRYENMVAHAMFSSSRRNGVRGIYFPEFFQSFLGEFQVSSWSKVALLLERESSHRLLEPIDILEGYCDDVGALSVRRVPFLAPPNSKWPPYILATNEDNCKFGHLVRPPNKERCDVFAVDLEKEKAMFVCECKYWDDTVNYCTIKNIIAGLNVEWHGRWNVVIVFCTDVTRFQQWEFNSIGCLKIKRGGTQGAMIASWISQPKQEERKKLMIIVETGMITAE
ncbi:unnamed protein product [Phytophthora fragariaefolia]|uniref:Unnamed protein product n=1 Tax=Phytophthora fragariaefolia TaxID=1490495 RepID=A0A9W6U148_9STRA|nr:unnamed protein product [Phytophthora fragariaefolia]